MTVSGGTSVGWGYQIIDLTEIPNIVFLASVFSVDFHLTLHAEGEISCIRKHPERGL